MQMQVAGYPLEVHTHAATHDQSEADLCTLGPVPSALLTGILSGCEEWCGQVQRDLGGRVHVLFDRNRNRIHFVASDITGERFESSFSRLPGYLETAWQEFQTIHRRSVSGATAGGGSMGLAG